MCSRNLPDMYALALGPVVLGTKYQCVPGSRAHAYISVKSPPAMLHP